MAYLIVRLSILVFCHFSLYVVGDCCFPEKASVSTNLPSVSGLNVTHVTHAEEGARLIQGRDTSTMEDFNVGYLILPSNERWKL